MNLHYLAFIGCLFFSAGSFAQDTIIVEGKYYGAPLILQHSFKKGYTSSNIQSIQVNGNDFNFGTQAKIEIDFTQFFLNHGDSVDVRVITKPGTTAYVLNPDALTPDAETPGFLDSMNKRNEKLAAFRNSFASMTDEMADSLWRTGYRYDIDTVQYALKHINAKQLRCWRTPQDFRKFSVFDVRDLTAKEKEGCELYMQVFRDSMYFSKGEDWSWRVRKKFNQCKGVTKTRQTGWKLVEDEGEQVIVLPVPGPWEIFSVNGNLLQAGSSVKVTFDKLTKGKMYYLKYQGYLDAFEVK